MRISLVLVTLFLVMNLRPTQSRCEERRSLSVRVNLIEPQLVNVISTKCEHVSGFLVVISIAQFSGQAEHCEEVQ